MENIKFLILICLIPVLGFGQKKYSDKTRINITDSLNQVRVDAQNYASDSSSAVEQRVITQVNGLISESGTLFVNQNDHNMPTSMFPIIPVYFDSSGSRYRIAFADLNALPTAYVIDSVNKDNINLCFADKTIKYQLYHGYDVGNNYYLNHNGKLSTIPDTIFSIKCFFVPDSLTVQVFSPFTVQNRINDRPQATYPIQEEYSTILKKFNNQSGNVPDVYTREYQNTLVAQLKIESYWDSLEYMYIFTGANDIDSYKVNWKDTSFLTLNQTGVFLVEKDGIYGNRTDGVDLMTIPLTMNNYTLTDSSNFSILLGVEEFSNEIGVSSEQGSEFFSSYGNAVAGLSSDINGNTILTYTLSDSSNIQIRNLSGTLPHGVYIFNRNSSLVESIFINGQKDIYRNVGSFSDPTSYSFQSSNMIMGGTNKGFNSKLSFFAFGTGLTDSKAIELNNIFNNYRQKFK